MGLSTTQYRKLIAEINLFPGYDPQTNLFLLWTLYMLRNWTTQLKRLTTKTWR